MHRPLEPRAQETQSRTHALTLANQYANALRVIQGTIHEINNDIGPLVGYLSIMEIGAQAEPKFVAAMQESVQRLQDHLTRISSQIKAPVSSTPVSMAMRPLVEGLIQTLRDGGFFRRIGVEIVVDPSFVRSGTPWVRVCPRDFSQVMTSLLGNAVDAMQDHGVSIEGQNQVLVVLRAHPSLVRVEIQDFGAGIGPGQEQLVFEEFYSTKPDRGLGLGLGVCRELVRKMQAQMEVDSGAAGGTRVYLTFPRVAQDF